MLGFFRKKIEATISELRSGEAMEIGRGATKAFLAFILVLAVLPNSLPEGGWELRIWTFLKAPPNEIGDTLAGLAGALAFLWIIVTVSLQSKELKAQREELAATRSELKMARQAQEQQVEVLEKQAFIFEDEQRQRREAQASRQLEDASKNIIRCFYEADLGTLVWEVGESSQRAQKENFLFHGFNQSHLDETSDRVLALLAELFGVAVQKMERLGREKIHYKPRLPAALMQLREYLEIVVGCLEDLPAIQAERQREVNLREAARSLNELIDGPYWDNLEGKP